MTSRGSQHFPPKDRNPNCRRCSGYGWVPLSPTEQLLVDEVESDHRTVFGTSYFGDHFGGGVPSQKFCPGCCGSERRSRDRRDFTQLRLNRRALRTLVNRVRRGEKFSEPHDDGVETMVQQLKDLADGTHSTVDSPLMKLARSPRPKQTRKPKKQHSTKVGLSGELAQLASLRRSGDLTDDEFIRAKQKLLGQSSSKLKKKRPARGQDDEGPPDLPEE